MLLAETFVVKKRLSTLHLVKRRQNMEAVVKTHELFISGYIPYVINPFRKKYDKNGATLP
jgi:hypothetical protein